MRLLSVACGEVSKAVIGDARELSEREIPMLENKNDLYANSGRPSISRCP